MIYIIAALDQNRVIGYKGKLPWHIANDLKHFKHLTLNQTLIMGRKTYLSLNKSLKDREVFVLSHDPHFRAMDIQVFSSLEKAIKAANRKDIFIAGGAEVYKEALPLADKLYLTEIDAAFKGDTYFPEFNKEDYEMRETESFNEPYHYRFVTYVRRKI